MSRSPAAILLAVLLPLAGLLDASHPAAAEDKAGKSIVDQLSDFLRGGSKAGPGTADQPPAAGAPAASPAAPAAPADDRRLPFGRAEMQLSFAPLVKQAVPAVVNVYASQQVRRTFALRRRSVLRAVLRRRRRADAAQSAVVAGLRRTGRSDRRRSSPTITSSATPTRSRSRPPTAANSKARCCSRTSRIDLAVLKIDSPRAVPGARRSAIPTRSRSATWCWRSAIRSASARPPPAASSRHSPARISASPISASSSRPTRRSIRAIPAARLIDMSGQLVGINTAIYSRSGGSIGIGFAIPVQHGRGGGRSRPRAAATISSGPMSAPTFEAVTPQIAESLGLDRPHGRADLRGRRRHAGGQGRAEARRCRAGDERHADRACRCAGLPAGDAADRQHGRACRCCRARASGRRSASRWCSAPAGAADEPK